MLITCNLGDAFSDKQLLRNDKFPPQLFICEINMLFILHVG